MVLSLWSVVVVVVVVVVGVLVLVVGGAVPVRRYGDRHSFIHRREGRSASVRAMIQRSRECEREREKEDISVFGYTAVLAVFVGGTPHDACGPQP